MLVVEFVRKEKGKLFVNYVCGDSDLFYVIRFLLFKNNEFEESLCGCVHVFFLKPISFSKSLVIPNISDKSCCHFR